MTTTDEHGRPEPPADAGEAATLRGYVAFLRATIDLKCAGLSDDDLGRALAPSAMTLGGLLTHLAFVEDYWCAFVVGGHHMPAPWSEMDWSADPDADWHLAASMGGDQARRLWRERVTASDDIVGSRLARGDAALSELYRRGDEQVSLRWVLTHLVEEYARHCGHADLLREAIDGQTGE